MANDGSTSDDLELEAQWCDEVAACFDTAARHYRRFAGLLRVAGRSLPPADIAPERLELRRVGYRLASILKAEDQRTDDHDRHDKPEVKP